MGGGSGCGGCGIEHTGVNHPDQVFLLHHRIFANELAGNAPVLRQHQQPGGINIQPPGGHQAFELAAMEEKAGVVLCPTVLRLHQGDGGLVAVFGLAAYQPQRLVDQDGDLIGLLALGRLVNLNAHIGQHLHAHFSHFAVDLDPAFANPFIGLTARGHAQLGHAFVQPDRAVGALCCGVALARRQGRATCAAWRGWRRSPAEGGGG